MNFPVINSHILGVSLNTYCDRLCCITYAYCETSNPRTSNHINYTLNWALEWHNSVIIEVHRWCSVKIRMTVGQDDSVKTWNSKTKKTDTWRLLCLIPDFNGWLIRVATQCVTDHGHLGWPRWRSRVLWSINIRKCPIKPSNESSKIHFC